MAVAEYIPQVSLVPPRRDEPALRPVASAGFTIFSVLLFGFFRIMSSSTPGLLMIIVAFMDLVCVSEAACNILQQNMVVNLNFYHSQIPSPRK